MLKNLSIKMKLMLIVFGTVIIISTAISIKAITTINTVVEQDIQSFSQDAYKQKEEELKSYVSMVEHTINSYYERTSKKKVKEEVSSELIKNTDFLFSIINKTYENLKKSGHNDKYIKDEIIKIVNATRYGKSGYFWINDMNSIIIEHPVDPKLITKDLTDVVDKNGKKFFKEFIKVIKTSGEGLVSYVWDKPGSTEPQEKVSFVREFKPFSWVIGTGKYVDDITSAMQKEVLKSIEEMKYGKEGYFWINDINTKMIMHATKPELNNKDLSNIVDAKGKYFFKEMVKVAKSEKKHGLVKYHWKTPKKVKPREKFSYVSHFEPWGWVIGTGAYVDNIEEKINVMREHASEEIQEAVFQILIMALSIIAVLSFVLKFVTQSLIIRPIEYLQDGILGFFRYLNRQSNEVDEVKVLSNDEIGTISKVINENIKKTKDGYEQDNKVIKESFEIIQKANNGFYQYNILQKANNPELEMLRVKINEMTDVMQASLSLVTEAMVEFANAKYNHKVKARYSGSIGSVVNSTSALGDSISEILCMVNNTAQRLTQNASDLAVTSEELSASAVEQASSLEETAAAIEEITSAIEQTSEKTQRMSQIATDLKQTSDEDDEIAHKTGEAMDHINKATTAIVDAIEIIDQIAFQTNILSLNAAVEAATAGEAGKGFAVVAQEVRNLASRSAEAAKEIKDLVEDAQNKTQEGKTQADKMVESFTSLNEKVSEVITIVSEVTSATSEQMQGMRQINNAVNELDKATQENANASETVSSKAMALNEISEHLIAIINRTQFDENRMNMVCDVNLVFDTTKLKLDHISFKENNFKGIGKSKKWTVKTDNECDLGKWIDTHSNEDYAQHSDWDNLKEAHHKVHSLVQEYININSENRYDSKLPMIANEIEENTLKVFDYLDQVKAHRCENAALERKRDIISTKDPIVYKQEIKELKKHCVNTTKKVIGNRSEIISN